MEDKVDILMGNYFVFFDIILGVYFLYCAITKKGSVYKSQFPEKYQGELTKMISIFMWIMGPLFLVSAAFDFFNPFGENDIASKILLGIEILAFAVFMILYKIKYDKINKIVQKELEEVRAEKRKERLEAMGRKAK